jgi:hypothetical protein
MKENEEKITVNEIHDELDHLEEQRISEQLSERDEGAEKSNCDNSMDSPERIKQELEDYYEAMAKFYAGEDDYYADMMQLMEDEE